MTVRKDLDGLRLEAAMDPDVYLMDVGHKRHIPDEATFNNLFRDWNSITKERTDLPTIDSGPDISVGAVLAQAYYDAAVYLIDGGKKRHIGSQATMDRYNFAWNRIYHVPPIIVASIPSGPSILWPE